MSEVERSLISESGESEGTSRWVALTSNSIAVPTYVLRECWVGERVKGKADNWNTQTQQIEYLQFVVVVQSGMEGKWDEIILEMSLPLSS